MPSRLIEIPPDDIFKNDRLGMEPAIQVQSEALLAYSPQAIAIDGPWGSGKTTFMALWEAYLRRENVKVVTFNAWKFSLSDPLDALTRAILHKFEDVPREQRQPSHRRLIKFVQRGGPLVRRGLKMASLFSPDLAETLDAFESVANSAQILADSVEAVTSGHTSSTEPAGAIHSPEAFTSALTSAAREWSCKPVVIMVDELDRCSPEYAVEMLQLLEHVFYAENVVFVVSMNRAELFHSVKAFYGQDFDADGYLERFFDNVFPLPSSNRLRYIESTFTSINAGDRGFNFPRALPFLYSSELSLREIDRAVNQLDEVLDSFTPSYSGLELVYLWLVRILAPAEYRRFISGETSDKSLADAVFDNGTCSELRVGEYEYDANQTYAMELEGVLILASYLRDQDPFSTASNQLSVRSELYAHYESETEGAGDIDSMRSMYSARVVDHASNLYQTSIFRRYDLDIVKAARLLDRDAIPS